MKFKKTATTLVAIMALVAANTGFAAIFCFDRTDLDNGRVQMSVQSVGTGTNLTSNATSNTFGDVTADASDCTTGKVTCTVYAQGTPGGSLVQLATFEFTDQDDPTGRECVIEKTDGLPVEVSKYSVE